MASSSSHNWCGISNYRSTRGDSVGIFTYQLIAASLHPWKCTTSGTLGIKCFQQSLDISGELCVSSFFISLPSFVPSFSTTCHRSIQTSHSSCFLLGGGSLACHSSQCVGRHSSSVYYCDIICHGCFSRPGAQGSAVTPFNPLALQRCVLHSQKLSSSVCQVEVGNLSIYNKSLPEVLERIGRLLCSRGYTKHCISAPK